MVEVMLKVATMSPNSQEEVQECFSVQARGEGSPDLRASRSEPWAAAVQEVSSCCAGGKDEGFAAMQAIRSWDSGFSTCVAPDELGLADACAFSDSGDEEAATGGAAPSGELQPGPPSTSNGRNSEWPECRDFKEGFELKRMLGEGAFGVVHSCVSRGTGKEYAVKVIRHNNLHPLHQASLLSEIQLQQALPAHQHIVGLHASFAEADSVKLVMDLCQGGDLYIVLDDAMQRHRWRGGDFALGDRAAANVARQLLEALAFCHAHGVVHRDVKPENVLLVHPEKRVRLDNKAAVIKLCDFGYATECLPNEPAALREQLGSPDYLAPEVAREESYGSGVDVWSAGALLFECLRGRKPFAAESERDTLVLVSRGLLCFDGGWSRIADLGQGCVRHLMQAEAAARPSAEAALCHPWLCS